MRKKEKPVKRVYEKGTERTISSSSKGRAPIKSKPVREVKKRIIKTSGVRSRISAVKSGSGISLGSKSKKRPAKKIVKKIQPLVSTKKSAVKKTGRKSNNSTIYSFNPDIYGGHSARRNAARKLLRRLRLDQLSIDDIDDGMVALEIEQLEATRSENIARANTVVARDESDLAPVYNDSKLTLLATSPLSIHAYWEVSKDAMDPASFKMDARDFERSKIVLRMYDVTLVDFNGRNANNVFDLEVGRHAGSWYVSLWSDNVSYIGEIGLKKPDGNFIALARSNFVHTPRLGYAGRTENIWLRVTDKGDTLKPFIVASVVPEDKIYSYQEPEANSGFGQGQYLGHEEGYQESHPTDGHSEASPREQKGSFGLIERVGEAAVRNRYKGGKKLCWAKKWKFIELSEDDVRRYYSRLSPLLRDVLSYRLSRHFIDSKDIKKKLGLLLQGESAEYRRRLFKLFPGRYFVRKMITGASEELYLLGGGSEEYVTSFGASMQGLTLRDQMNRRKFFFELNTELIVYGRTEPDASVYLGTRKIDLRKDGTFSMRFALPDGKVPLEFTAVSNDKIDERRIFTYVDRNTLYPV